MQTQEKFREEKLSIFCIWGGIFLGEEGRGF
jgi:hypothetical protein